MCLKRMISDEDNLAIRKQNLISTQLVMRENPTFQHSSKYLQPSRPVWSLPGHKLPKAGILTTWRNLFWTWAVTAVLKRILKNISDSNHSPEEAVSHVQSNVICCSSLGDLKCLHELVSYLLLHVATRQTCLKATLNPNKQQHYCMSRSLLVLEFKIESNVESCFILFS